jgi:hypothetical protein
MRYSFGLPDACVMWFIMQAEQEPSKNGENDCL